MSKNRRIRQPRVAIAIMAAGKGHSPEIQTSESASRGWRKPLLAYVIAAARKLFRLEDIFAIIGHEAQNVRSAVAGSGINFVLQPNKKAPDMR